ncbi:MAG: flippase-like domain-containing protein [Alloprevotella sp.]|nr:flippase-like domain-containing protein [Alloprevotella sp.]
MRPLYRNLFLLFGVVAIGVMLYSFGVDFGDLRTQLRQTGLYLPAVIGVWVIVYAFNAGAYQLIVNSGTHDKHLSYRHAYKLTVSGFAFSYTTPFGFGGAPYRVLDLSAHIGTPRAMSSTVLYSMMHILSHFCLWLTGLLLFAVVRFGQMTPLLWTLSAVFLGVCAIVAYFFWYGYRNGMIVKLYSLLLHLPFVKRYARTFYERNAEAMEQVDRNIAYLHSQPRAFYGALLLEYVGRVVNSLEFFFILRSLSVPVGLADSIIVLAFSSLIGNLLFFFPMQLGAREGSLAAIVRILGFGAPAVGIFASFYTRIRELFWIFVGVLLVKVGNKSIMK